MRMVYEGMPLDKGEISPLTKGRQEMEMLRVDMGWRSQDHPRADLDLDVSVFMINKEGSVPSGRFCVYYNNLVSPDGSTKHDGDILTAAEGESIKIELGRVHPDIQQIVFGVSIYRAERRSQNFGMVRDIYVEFHDDTAGEQIQRYDVTASFLQDTGLVIGAVLREGGEWHFVPVVKGYLDGFKGMGLDYGVNFA
jgi:tellurium resistance protein TerD